MNIATELTETRRERESALLRDLRNRVAEVGCFSPTPWAYGIKIAVIIAAVAFGYAVLLGDPGPAARVAVAMVIAFATVQAGFIAHDAGDGAVTANRRVSHALRHFLMSFLSALSSSYFHYLHRIHHLTVQHGGRGLSASGYAVNPYEIHWLKRLVAWNGIVFAVTTVCLRGLTFKLESLRYVLRNPAETKSDRVLMVLHALVWLILPVPLIGVAHALINYGLITLLIGPYVGTVLILNHEGMSKAESQTHLPMIERITSSTRNLGRSWWSDFVFGGVNNHIEHHLFPQIPAKRLWQARSVTQAFLRERGIPYEETGFIRAVVAAARHFRAVPPDRLVAEALS